MYSVSHGFYRATLC